MSRAFSNFFASGAGFWTACTGGGSVFRASVPELDANPPGASGIMNED
jgi:hypothetical protein